MKKICFNALYAVICIGLAFVAAACGDKSATADDFAKLGAADDIVVLTGNVSDILRNAACKATADGIELSPALTKILELGVSSAREKKEIENGLKLRGVGYDNCFFKLTADQDFIFAFGLTDVKAFHEWMVKDMENDAPVSEDGYEVYNLDKEIKLITDDGAAYFVYRNHGVSNVAFFNGLKEKAAANPLSSWQIDALSQNKTCVALFNARKFIESIDEDEFRAVGGAAYANLDALKKGFIEVDAQLKGMKLHITTKMLDADGNAIKADFKFKNIDLKVFDYINGGDIMAAALNLGGDIDWNQILATIDAQMGGQLSRGTYKLFADKIVEVLGNIDGTVFISAHPKDLQRMSQGAQYWDGTIGAQMKKGAAEQYINEIKALAAQFGMQPTVQDGATVFDIAPFTIYMKDVNGMLVISTQPITGKGGSILVQSYFKGNAAAIEATLAKGSDFGAGALPFQPVIAISGNGESASFDVEFIGEGDYLLDTLFRYIASQIR